MNRTHAPDTDAEQESHNIIVLAVHQVLIRVAWVFKTETVIMPAFMDHIAGAGWLRGCLPVLNRFGQSIPPLLLSEKLRNARYKKWTLLTSSIVMSIPFLVLAAIWVTIEEKRQPWLPYVFLMLYLCFFSAVGINQLAFGTVQGKLIRADRRGRLMSIAGIVGTFFSVAGLLLFLTDWLEREDGGFGLIFGFTGIGFVIGGLSVAFIKESADQASPTKWAIAQRFRESWQTLMHDTGLQRLAIVSVCFSPLMLLFPHYQALGRQGATIQASGSDLMMWVAAQNITVGLYSLVAGYIADRFGNRLVLRGQLLVGAATPLIALSLASTPGDNTLSDWYWVTFAMLGVAPVTLRTLTNFNLELTTPDNHPLYVSTLNVCIAVPFAAAPLVGYLVDAIGFTVVFLFCSCITATGCVLTFWLPEPRHDQQPGSHSAE